MSKLNERTLQKEREEKAKNDPKKPLNEEDKHHVLRNA